LFLSKYKKWKKSSWLLLLLEIIEKERGEFLFGASDTKMCKQRIYMCEFFDSIFRNDFLKVSRTHTYNVCYFYKKKTEKGIFKKFTHTQSLYVFFMRLKINKNYIFRFLN
jgi:hypothetical protein